MKILSVFIIVFFLFEISYGQKLDLQIKSNKQEYVKYEPIWITITARNIGRKDVNINFALNPAYHDLKFVLKDSSGIIYKYKGMTVDTRSVKFRPLKLKENESISYTIDLLTCFGERDTLKYNFVLDTGYFKIKGTLKYDGSFLESNSLDFYIMEQTEEEKFVYTFYIDRFRDWKINKDTNLLIASLRDLLNFYPSTVYADQIYDQIFNIYSLYLNDDRKVIEVGEELLNKNPQSPYSINMVRHIARSLESLGEKDEMESKLNKIAKKFKEINPEITQECEKELKKLK